MNTDTIKSSIPDYARDLKLNLSSIMTPEGSAGLTQDQIYGVALSSAITARNIQFTTDIKQLIKNAIDQNTYTAAKSAAAIMGMNNIYYRSVHLITDKTYMSLPAKLRMNVIGKPGVDKIDFELYSLAASAINGCGMCLDAHEKELRKQGASQESIQSVLRIAAVIHAVAAVLEEHEVMQKAA